jgi:phosphoglucomutase
MSVHPRAGTPADSSDLIDVPRVVSRYYTEHPDAEAPEQRVAFGTSGHRGSSLNTAFNEDHIVATSQAIVEYRKNQGTDGPLFLGRDTHALSEPAMVSALEVFAANDVTVLIDSRDGYTPTPALSHAILVYNRGRTSGLADGVVVTPSHNPPQDGGFKYNPPERRPRRHRRHQVDPGRANALIAAGLKEVRRVPAARARAASTVSTYDYLARYIDDLSSVIDMDAIRSAVCGSAPTRSAGPASRTGGRSVPGTAWT